jgi:hypothetical protein
MCCELCERPCTYIYFGVRHSREHYIRLYTHIPCMQTPNRSVRLLVEEGRLLERKSRRRLSSHPSMTLSRLGYSRHRRRSSCPPRTRQSQAPARDRSRLGAAAIAGVAPPQHLAWPARPCARPPRRAARMRARHMHISMRARTDRCIQGTR